MVRTKFSYLSPEEAQYMEERESLKEIRKQNLELQKERELAKSETPYGQLRTEAKGLFKFKKPINSKITKSRYKQTLQPIQPAPLISKEQDMLQDLFGGRGENRVMFGGNGECATKVDGALMPNNFGNEIEDGEQTSDHFGFGSRHETGGFFGI
jgi:hypothetical protein